jgi:histidyl-tRNA synthetase
MIRGTRMLMGDEAKLFRFVTEQLRTVVTGAGYQEVIVSAMAENEVFVEKAGPEILNQMYTFKDKGDRDICLIPEVTAIIQKEYKAAWEKTLKKPVKIFYLSRCYRYERPQEGRYREFWQFGVEALGGKVNKDEMINLLNVALNSTKVDFKLNDGVKRGLNYYVEDGFEAEVEKLGAQKQIAGGGRYDCGIGWAIGVDRLMLALQKKE